MIEKSFGKAKGREKVVVIFIKNTMEVQIIPSQALLCTHESKRILLARPEEGSCKWNDRDDR
jgi:hypothetical protein